MSYVICRTTYVYTVYRTLPGSGARGVSVFAGVVDLFTMEAGRSCSLLIRSAITATQHLNSFDRPTRHRPHQTTRT
eukprot:3872227-Heterocapsa_arctica.AAC.1